MKINAEHPFRSSEAKAQFLASYDARTQLWPVPSQTRTIETSYGPTFVRMSGPSEGPPLALLHGHSENGLNWLPNIEALSQSYRTYAIDTISDPGRSVYTKLLKSANDYTTWLDELFDGLGLAQGINLMGLSYGGWLTSHYALRFPERLNKIILMAPGGIAPLPWKFIIVGMLLIPFRLRIKFLFKRITHWMFNDFIEINENGEETFEQWFDFLYLGLQSYKSQPILLAKRLTDEQLRKLRLPTLFLTGENEIIYDVNFTIKRLEKIAPNIHIKVIQKAGHDLPWAQPQKVNVAILDFLKDP